MYDLNFPSDQDKEEAALREAKRLLSPYGYKIVKSDRVMRFCVQEALSDPEWMWARKEGILAQYKEAKVERMSRALGVEMVKAQLRNDSNFVQDIVTEFGYGWRIEMVLITAPKRDPYEPY